MTDVYPDSAGHRGVDTSIAAGEALNRHLGNFQRLVLADIIASGGFGRTSMECAQSVGLAYDTVQPRISELRRLGQVRDSGWRRPNPTGKKAIVWVAGGAA